MQLAKLSCQRQVRIYKDRISEDTNQHRGLSKDMCGHLHVFFLWSMLLDRFAHPVPPFWLTSVVGVSTDFYSRSGPSKILTNRVSHS
jgi:hypothetical protein